MSITKKFTLLAGSLALIVILFVGFVSYTAISNLLFSAIAEKQEEYGVQTLDKIDRILYQQQINIQSIAEANPFEDFLEDPSVERALRATERLREVKLLEGPWDKLTVIDLTGTIVLATEPEDIAQHITLYPDGNLAYQRALQKKRHSSDLLIASSTNKPAMIFAYPIRSAMQSGRPVIGVMIGYYAWPQISEIIVKASHAHGPLLHLVNSSGQILASANQTNPTKILQKNSPAAAMIQSDQRSPRTSLTSGILDASQSLSTYVKEKGYLSYAGNGWWLIVEAPTNTALLPARSQALNITMTLVGLLVVSVIVWLYLSHRLILRPIQLLQQTITAISLHGKLTTVPFQRNDEIGVLARSFNEMIENLKQLDNQKSEFVSLASHQLRSPLTAVSWYSETLLNKHHVLDVKTRTKYLDEVYQSTQRMIQLVDSLLNTSRLELGTFTIQPEHIDLVHILKQMIKEYDMQIREKSLSVSFSHTMPRLLFWGDMVLVRIIFQNLLTNAIKYTHTGGSIAVTLEHHKSPILTVTDTGIGIPLNNQPKIFTKLFRAENVQRENEAGTGLGLYIVHKILEYVGGSISFTSVEGKGSMFTVLLPTGGMKHKKGNKSLHG